MSWRDRARRIIDSHQYEVKALDGKTTIGTVGYEGYKAIENNTIDRYKPKSSEEQKTLEAVKTEYGELLGLQPKEGASVPEKWNYLKKTNEIKFDKITKKLDETKARADAIRGKYAGEVVENVNNRLTQPKVYDWNASLGLREQPAAPTTVEFLAPGVEKPFGFDDWSAQDRVEWLSLTNEQRNLSQNWKELKAEKEAFDEVNPYNTALINNYDPTEFGYEQLFEWAMNNGFAPTKRVGGYPVSWETEKEMREKGLWVNDYIKYSPKDKKTVTKEQKETYKMLEALAEENDSREFASEHPFAASVTTILDAPSRGIKGVYLTLKEGVKNINGKPIDIYSDDYDHQRKTNTIRSTVDEEYASKWFGGAKDGEFNWGSWLYNTSMSLGDNVATALVAGGFGKAASAAGVSAPTVKVVMSNTASTLMSGEVLANSIISAKERGLDDEQALALAIGNALVEFGTERVGFDSIFKSPAKTLKGTLVRAGISNAGEEMSAEILNKVWDEVISQDNSEMNLLIKSYMEKGYSKKEATSMAWGDAVVDVLAAGASGGLSGMTMSAGYEATPSARTGRKNWNSYIDSINETIKTINKNGGYNIELLSKTATEKEVSSKLSEVTAIGVDKKDFISEKAAGLTDIIKSDTKVQDTFGENGQKAFEANYREEQDANVYTQGFNQFYRRGFIGQDYKTADRETQGTTFGNMMSEDQKTSAYYAGVNDAKISLERQKNNVQFVTTYGKDSGVVDNEIARSYDNEVIQTVDRFAKAVGAKVEFVDTLEGGTVNGLIEDGYIQIAKDADNPVSVIIGHEITHRMQQLAPEAYASYRNYVVQNNPKLVADISSGYAKAGRSISQEALMDEVAAEYTGYILNSPETINKFIDDARNGKLVEGGTIEENMGVVKRLWQSIKDFIDKVKKLFKGDKKAQDKAAKDAFGMPMSELEKARDLLGKAFVESEKVVKGKETPSVSKADSSLKDGAKKKDGDIKPEREYFKEAERDLNGSKEKDDSKESDHNDSGVSEKDVPKESGITIMKKDGSYSSEDGGMIFVSEGFEDSAFEEKKTDVKLSIKNIPNTNKLYVKADEQVIKSQNPDDWEAEIFDYVNKVVRKGKDFVIPMDNEESIVITGRTAWKLSDRGNFADDYYMVKGNASGVIDEIISVSKYLRSKPPMKLHSDGFAKYGFDYRKAYFMDLDGKYYELQLSVGINAEGREAYNIGQIKQVAFPSKRLKGPKGTTTSKDNIPQKNGSVNTQSMQKTENNSGERKTSLKMDDVLKQNALLKKINAQLNKSYLELQSGKKVADTKRIASVVKNLLDESDFAYSSTKLTEQFESLTAEAQAIFEGKMDFETFSGKVRDVAESVIAEGTRQDSVVYQESKKLRDYLRTTKISLNAEEKANLGDDYETIRKGTFGRLRLVKEGGLPIDIAYQEMSVLFPEYFNEETEVGGSAQLRKIVEVLDGLQLVKNDPFEGYADEAADWLSGMMIDRIFNEVFVSGSTGKVDVSVDMKALRESMGDNLQNIMNRERTWRTREYDKLQKKFEKKTKTYTESRQKAIKIKQVKLHTERISKALVNPSERFAVPEDLKKPVAEFLQCIDLTSDRMGDKTREQLGDLMKTYKAMAEQEYELNMVIDPDLYNNLETISDSIKELGTKDTRISDLPLATLEKMRNAVMAMEASLRNYNKAFREGKAVQIDALAEKAVAEIKELRKDNKKNSKIWGGASDLMNFDMLNPFDYFHQMGDTFEDLFMGLREGENVQIRDLALAKNNLDKQMEAFGIDPNKLNGKKAKAQKFKLANGETVEFTKAQVMSLYLLWRQNASHEHILEGGFRPGEVQQKLIEKKGEDSKVVLKVSEDYSSVRPSLDDVAKILDTLSDNEKKFAESVSDFFVNECAEWGNEVAMKLYGYKKFNTPNYFPIVSDKMYLQEDFGVSADSTIKNTGFTKKRVKHANNPVIIEDIFEVYARHTSDMAKYHGYVLPLQDIQRVFNSSGFAGENNVKALIGSKYGRKAITYFSKLMNDINAGIKNEYGSAWSSKMISKYKQAKMGANVRVVIQQPVSYLRAAAIVDPKYLAAASGHKVDLETVFKYSPIAQWKDWGFFSIDTGKSMYDLMTGKTELSDYTMALAGKADQMTWKKLWNVVERETADLHPELVKGSEAFYKAVGKRFDYIIDRTQVVDSTLHRSQILRSPDTLTKMSVSFMSEPMKTYNLLRTSVVDAIMRGDKKGLARTVAVAAISSIVLACVTGGYDTLTGEEDEEFWKNFTDNLIGDYTGMIPYVKDIASIIQGYDVKRMDVQSFADVINAVKMFASDRYTLKYKIANMSMKAADLFGVPVSSFKRSVYDTVVRNIFRSMDNYWLDYNLAKMMYPVNGKMKKEFINVLFEAYSAGDKESYDKIFADMMKSGIDAKSIESGLKSRYKNSGMIETFPVTWNNKLEIPQKETPDKFDLEDLTDEQYAKYYPLAVKLEEDVVGDIKSMKGNFDDETYNKMLSAAYDYVEEVALETTAPDEYDIETGWILLAMDAEKKYGIDPSTFIQLKEEFGISKERYNKFDKVDDVGIDFEEYVQFADFAGDTKSDPEDVVNGKLKQEKIIDELFDMNLTPAQKDDLWFEVMKYSAKKKPVW